MRDKGIKLDLQESYDLLTRTCYTFSRSCSCLHQRNFHRHAVIKGLLQAPLTTSQVAIEQSAQATDLTLQHCLQNNCPLLCLPEFSTRRIPKSRTMVIENH